MEFIIVGLIFLILIYVVGSVIIWSIRNGISPMPTSPKVKKHLLQLLPDKIDGPILELGSGWGTLAIPLARRYPSCQVIGYETSPIPHWFSKVRLLISRLSNLSFQRKDFFTEELSDAGLIICYLYPEAMRKLQEKFERELKSGTIIISNTFAIPDWQPSKIQEVNDLYSTKIYLYTIDSKK